MQVAVQSPVTSTELYPYDVQRATSLSLQYCNFSFDESIQDAISEDAKVLETAFSTLTPANTISLDSLKKICSLVQIFSSQIVHYKGAPKQNPFVPDLLTNSLDIVPNPDKTKTVYISLHKMLHGPTGSQGISVKEIVMTKFDGNNRLIRAKSIVKSIVCLVFRENTPNAVCNFNRISVMQKVQHSKYFPKNYAFVQVQGVKGSKVRIFQERAFLDLIEYDNSQNGLSKIPNTSKYLIAHNIWCAVRDLHKVGVYHRDLKLDNVLCFTQGQKITNVKVTDLGLAIDSKDTQRLSTASGSFTCVAPEVIRKLFFGAPFAMNEKSDIWSLGLIIYSLFEGRLPDIQIYTFALQESLKNVGDFRNACRLFKKTNRSLLETAILIEFMKTLGITQRVDYSDADFAIMKAAGKTKLAKHQSNLKKWSTALAKLPKPPTQIKSLLDLSICMLQEDPNKRIEHEAIGAAFLQLEKSYN